MMDDKFALWAREIRRFNHRLKLVSPSKLHEIRPWIQENVSLLSKIKEQTIADLGAGSGILGITYKILHPLSEVSMIERSHRKSLFLQHVIQVIGLEGIEVIEADPLKGETERFDAVMTRAFSPKARLLEALSNIIEPGGHFYYISTNTLNTSSTDLELINQTGLDQGKQGASLFSYMKKVQGIRYRTIGYKL